MLMRRIEQETVHLHPPVNPLVISGQHLALEDSAGSRKLVCNERCKGLSKSGSFCKPRSGRVPLGCMSTILPPRLGDRAAPRYSARAPSGSQRGEPKMILRSPVRGLPVHSRLWHAKAALSIVNCVTPHGKILN